MNLSLLIEKIYNINCGGAVYNCDVVVEYVRGHFLFVSPLSPSLSINQLITGFIKFQAITKGSTAILVARLEVVRKAPTLMIATILRNLHTWIILEITLNSVALVSTMSH